MYDAILYRRPYPSYIFQTPLLIAIIQGNDMSHIFRRSMVATNSLTHKTHGIWSATPQQIKEHNMRSKLKRSLKREMLSKYKLHV